MGLKLAIALFFLIGLGRVAAGAQEMQIKPTRQVSWGIYQILWSLEQFETELSQQLNLLGGTPKYVLFFRDLDRKRGFPLQAIEICDRNNLIPVVSFEPAPWRDRQSSKALQDIADGHWDEYFQRWGQAAARWSKPVIFRFGFEMNGGWFSWGQRPELFKKTWHRIHRLFRQAKAGNIQWMFAPNVAPEKSSALQNPLTYYPGDDVVDYVAVDGYNFGDHHDRWHRWQSYQAVFEATLAALSKLKKPLFISEIGCADDSRKPIWIEDFLKRVSTDQRISAFIYYNYYPKRRGYPNWRLNSDDMTLRVFRKWANSQTDVRSGADNSRFD